MRCPIAYRWKLCFLSTMYIFVPGYLKAAKRTLSFGTRLRKRPLRALYIYGQCPRYDRRWLCFLSASFMMLCFFSLEFYGVSETSLCVPKRTGHTSELFHCWYRNALPQAVNWPSYPFTLESQRRNILPLWCALVDSLWINCEKWTVLVV